MSTTLPPARTSTRPGGPTLANGDRLTQAEFHARYARRTDATRFELVGGIVFMASPVHAAHAEVHTLLTTILGVYAMRTPGVRGATELSTVLSPADEVQPDILLRLLPEVGGAARVAMEDGVEKHLEGAPELVVEVAHSSRALDLHRKRDAYRAAGVKEYLVASLADEEVLWWALPEDRRLEPHEGVLRSEVFPGLRLDPTALFARDGARLLAALDAGLATEAHAAFVRSLER